MTNEARVQVWLVYSDYPASLAAAASLVNDLDLIVQSPTGGRWYDRRSEQPNRTDNVESVEGRSGAGTCIVWVVGHHVPMGPQAYALVARISALPTGELRVEDVEQEPSVVRPDVSVRVRAHVMNTISGAVNVRLWVSTNETEWFSLGMVREVITERGGVYGGNIAGLALGTVVRYFVEAWVEGSSASRSETNNY